MDSLKLKTHSIQLVLAPMEGVTDWVMRDLLTSIQSNSLSTSKSIEFGIDRCVTEFLRVTDTVYPDSVFYKNCPELLTNSKTRSGTPVYIQLLGGHPEPLALNALKAVYLGALGIDLNFGCPAKTVNRHDGGASLLNCTDRIFNIVQTVRKTVPFHIPVTAKIRLGVSDPSQCLENALAITQAGAQALTVHCRTKLDGYKPPAFWEWIPKIKQVTKIPVIANGEIWTFADFQKCKEETSCTEFMIGRGALRNPFLFSEIKQRLSQDKISIDNSVKALSIDNAAKIKKETELNILVSKFYEASVIFKSESFAMARTKQWLNQLSQSQQNYKSIFNQLKIIENPIEFKKQLDSSLNLRTTQLI